MAETRRVHVLPHNAKFPSPQPGLFSRDDNSRFSVSLSHENSLLLDEACAKSWNPWRHVVGLLQPAESRRQQ